MAEREVHRSSTILLFGITQAVGILLSVLVLVWIFTYRNGFSRNAGFAQFNWHPILLTIGMIYLYANAMFIFRFLTNMRKNNQKYLHAGIHSFIVVLIIIGLYAVIAPHLAKNKPNFYTLHSWLGIATSIIFFLQWLSGLVTFLYPGLSPPVKAATLPFHVYFGLAAFVLSTATCITGFLETAVFKLKESYKDLPAHAILINIIGLLYALFGLLVVYLVTRTNYTDKAKDEKISLS